MSKSRWVVAMRDYYSTLCHADLRTNYIDWTTPLVYRSRSMCICVAVTGLWLLSTCTEPQVGSYCLHDIHRCPYIHQMYETWLTPIEINLWLLFQCYYMWWQNLRWKWSRSVVSLIERSCDFYTDVAAVVSWLWKMLWLRSYREFFPLTCTGTR